MPAGVPWRARWSGVAWLGLALGACAAIPVDTTAGDCDIGQFVGRARLSNPTPEVWVMVDHASFVGHDPARLEARLRDYGRTLATRSDETGRTTVRLSVLSADACDEAFGGFRERPGEDMAEACAPRYPPSVTMFPFDPAAGEVFGDRLACLAASPEPGGHCAFRPFSAALAALATTGRVPTPERPIELVVITAGDLPASERDALDAWVDAVPFHGSSLSLVTGVGPRDHASAVAHASLDGCTEDGWRAAPVPGWIDALRPLEQGASLPIQLASVCAEWGPLAAPRSVTPCLCSPITCLPRPITPGSCELVAVIDDDVGVSDCGQLPGWLAGGEAEDGRLRCVMRQAAADLSLGWRYTETLVTDGCGLGPQLIIDQGVRFPARGDFSLRCGSEPSSGCESEE